MRNNYKERMVDAYHAIDALREFTQRWHAPQRIVSVDVVWDMTFEKYLASIIIFTERNQVAAHQSFKKPKALAVEVLEWAVSIDIEELLNESGGQTK